MERVLGYWKLKENRNFNNFLIFTNTSWFERGVALNCSIDVYISCFLTNPTGLNHYNKKVKSMFYNVSENIILDNKQRKYDTLVKKYYVKEGIINTDILGTIVNWQEQIYINNNNNLIIKYIWRSDEKVEEASQEFIRSNLAP